MKWRIVFKKSPSVFASRQIKPPITHFRQMSEKNRPTSPHLQIYKWNISSLTSISHRFTGVLLYAAILAIAWYITYYAYQLDFIKSNELVEEDCNCPIKEIIKNLVYAASLFIAFALYYHLLNGIRHLFWDYGKGFEKNFAKKTGMMVVLGALVLTLATIFIF